MHVHVVLVANKNAFEQKILRSMESIIVNYNIDIGIVILVLPWFGDTGL